MRISGSFDLFPQHCIMPMFTCEKHAMAVHNELTKAIHALNIKARKRIIRAMAMSIKTMMTNVDPRPQRVAKPQTPEDKHEVQRVGPAPPVTTTMNPTAPV